MSEHTVSVEDAAKARGQVVVVPARDQLFIDIDSVDAMAIFEAHLPTLQKMFEGVTFEKRQSPGGAPERAHIYVKLPRPLHDDVERIALQAVLGSDLKHEILSLRDFYAGAKTATVFFEKPAEETVF